MRAGDRVGPDPAVVAAARAGDQRALDQLVAECLPLVYNIVGRALDGRDDVDDVVQETLLRVVRGLAELREPAAFRSWLVAIAVRQVRDREQARKAAWHQQTALDAAELIPDPASDFASVTILRLGLTDQRREIAEATRWLDPADRTLLALWWLEETGDIGRTELAGALGLSRQHAAVKVQRMKEQLETSRTVVRALGAADPCPDLGGLTAGWDGVPSPLWRKRLARHIRGCGTCTHRGGALLPMDRLLTGLPLLPVPVGMAFHPPAPTAPPGPPSPAASDAAPRTAPPPHHPPRRSGAREGKSAARAGGRAVGAGRGALGVPAAAVGAVAAVAAGALLAVHLSSGRSAPAASVTSARPGAAAPVTATPVTTTPPAPTTKARATAKPPAATRRPAPPATAHGAVPQAPPAAASSVRKGVGVWSFPGVSTALARSGAGWYYTWSTTHSGISGPGFVPMVWGAKSTDAASLAQAERAPGPYLLGFNEPDMAQQSDMTVEQALALWPKLLATGKTLGSPAVAYGADTPGGWLDRFMAGARQKGYRVDFIALHWYGGDFTTPEAVAQLRSYLEAVHNRYHKPVWLTEFALIDFAGGTRFPTDREQAAFVTAATGMLDGLPWLRRYAWFGLGADDAKPSSGLFRSGPVETPAGRAFEAAR